MRRANRHPTYGRPYDKPKRRPDWFIVAAGAILGWALGFVAATHIERSMCDAKFKEIVKQVEAF